MPLLNIVIVIVVVGVGLWAIDKFIPMARPVKTILNIVVVVTLCLWLARVTGLMDSIQNMRVN